MIAEELGDINAEFSFALRGRANGGVVRTF